MPEANFEKADSWLTESVSENKDVAELLIAGIALIDGVVSVLSAIRKFRVQVADNPPWLLACPGIAYRIADS